MRNSIPALAFTLCPSYHGATLFSLLLANSTQIFSLGDTLPVKSYDQLCGCGKSVSKCEFWANVRRQVGVSGYKTIIPEHPLITKNQRINFWALAPFISTTIKLGVPFKFEKFSENTTKFIDCCMNYRRHLVFLDGSKDILRYLALKSSGFDIRAVFHLVRDPRAFSASAMRKGNLSAIQAAKAWVRSHRKISSVLRILNEKSIVIRYEDLCSETEVILREVQLLLEVEHEALIRDLDKNHWMGNSSLFKFSGIIKESQKWKEELTQRDQSQILKTVGGFAEELGYYA